ncbi:discoidin domain-containing protein [Mucilaginibacter sp. UYCu711]|uniref:discoidin domain-containing protein n=1 Tax=Mucilaginibacter sp. UYCu711 TaxID=3156339 RepID=UPI003D1F4AF2
MHIKLIKLIKEIFICFTIIFTPVVVSAQKDVLTQHNNLYRTGWYSSEKILNTKNVKQGSFGKIFSRAVDDQIYAQPLVKLNLSIPGKGKRNVVFVATVNNTVYAFDADSANRSIPYWKVNLTPRDSRPVKNSDMTEACAGNYRDFTGNIGIVGTPVIDPATNTIYLVSRNFNTIYRTYEQYIHALDITTGVARPNSPTLITARVSGLGSGSVRGKIYFDAQKENQRCGLLLLRGIVYVTWASHCDWTPYHGWILGYDKKSLTQKIVYNTTPQGYNGGIWMSGAAPAADEYGNLYVAVGNGSVGVGSDLSDVTNRSESAVKLKPQGSKLIVKTFFTPNNILELEETDLDFGVTEVMLVPGTTMAITACKDGKIYILNRNNMGGYHSDGNKPLQTINLGTNAHLRSSFTYYKGQNNQFVYSWSENGLLKAFPLDRTSQQLDLTKTISSGVQGPTGNSGAFLSISSNNSIDSTAVLWATYAADGDANQAVRSGILRAFSASDITKELWHSSSNEANGGNYAKFNCPTIINGKVYLATFSNKLNVYGLTKNIDTCNSINIALNKKGVASSDEGNVNTSVDKAFDGDKTSRWASKHNSDAESIYVDLGAQFNICQVVLRWEVALAKSFDIQVSDDAINWSTISSLKNNLNSDNYISLKATGRYVRMKAVKRGSPYGYSLYEFEVYGEPVGGQCPAPRNIRKGIITENSAEIKWDGSVGTGYILQYKAVAAVGWTNAKVTVNDIIIKGLSCATDYLVRVQTNCTNGGVGAVSTAIGLSTLPCSTICGPLPTRWTTQDIGDVGMSGSACYKNDVFTLYGGGQSSSNIFDALHFAYKTFVGNGEITARVVTLDQSSGASSGIMIRESIAPGAKYAFIGLTKEGCTFQYRLKNASSPITTGSPAKIKAPCWVKLLKVKSLYTAYISSNGVDWIPFKQSIDLNFGATSPVYVGLSISSNNNTTLAVATIDNCKIDNDSIKEQKRGNSYSILISIIIFLVIVIFLLQKKIFKY